MFTAWGSQTPFRQIGHKGTTNNAHTQAKREFYKKYNLHQPYKLPFNYALII